MTNLVKIEGQVVGVALGSLNGGDVFKYASSGSVHAYMVVARDVTSTYSRDRSRGKVGTIQLSNGVLRAELGSKRVIKIDSEVTLTPEDD